MVNKLNSTILQVALDLIDLDKALRIAQAAVNGGIDWIEVGTPLVKAVGIKAVEEMKNKFPSIPIIADLKTMDTGFLETELAAKAGASVVCILGVAADSTIQGAVQAGKQYGVKIHVDLINVSDLIKRAKEVETLGVDYIGLHVGVDQQSSAGYEKNLFSQVKKVKETVSIPVAVAGGLKKETIHHAIKSGARVLIVGGSITGSSNPEEATRVLKAAINKTEDNNS